MDDPNIVPSVERPEGGILLPDHGSEEDEAPPSKKPKVQVGEAQETAEAMSAVDDIEECR